MTFQAKATSAFLWCPCSYQERRRLPQPNWLKWCKHVMPMSSALTGAVDRKRCFFKWVVGKIDCMSRVLDILLFTNPSYLGNNDENLSNVPFLLFHKPSHFIPLSLLNLTLPFPRSFQNIPIISLSFFTSNLYNVANTMYFLKYQ